MKSKKAILIMIAGAICFASGVILHFETKNACTYILYILGYILIILANKIEINKKIDSIDLNENTNSIMKKFLYKPLIITIIPIILIVCIVNILLPGFTKVTTICIDDFVISEDEQKMTIQISNISSSGFVRKVLEDSMVLSEQAMNLRFH